MTNTKYSKSMSQNGDDKNPKDKKMNLKIEATESTEDMVRLLEHVAGLIEQGYTSGYHPYWELTEE